MPGEWCFCLALFYAMYSTLSCFFHERCFTNKVNLNSEKLLKMHNFHLFLALVDPRSS